MQNKIKVGFIQQHNTNDINDNMQRLKRGIEQLAKQGAQLIVLQELHNSLYFCQIETVDNFDLAEPIPGPSTAFFSEIAAANNVVIVTSLFEKRAAGLYHNTSVVIEKDGSIAGKYRKMHIPDDPAYYEKFYFTPGDLGFVPIQTSLGKLGILVCWDQWYPEAARLMALNGAELLIYPTAIGYESSERCRGRESTPKRGMDNSSKRSCCGKWIACYRCKSCGIRTRSITTNTRNYLLGKLICCGIARRIHLSCIRNRGRMHYC